MHGHKVELKTKYLFQFCLTITEPFSPVYLEDIKTIKVLSFSRTVSQLIMRGHQSKVEYKLVLQGKTP